MVVTGKIVILFRERGLSFNKGGYTLPVLSSEVEVPPGWVHRAFPECKAAKPGKTQHGKAARR